MILPMRNLFIIKNYVSLWEKTRNQWKLNTEKNFPTLWRGKK